MEKFNLTDALNKLEEINDWFDNQQEIDVEKGLEKVKEGVQLVKASKKRLQEVENEFEEVKKELVQNTGKAEEPVLDEPSEINPADIPF